MSLTLKWLRNTSCRVVSHVKRFVLWFCTKGNVSVDRNSSPFLKIDTYGVVIILLMYGLRKSTQTMAYSNISYSFIDPAVLIEGMSGTLKKAQTTSLASRIRADYQPFHRNQRNAAGTHWSLTQPITRRFKCFRMTSPSYLTHNAGNKRLGTRLLLGSYGDRVMCRVEEGNYTHNAPLHRFHYD